jgi:hypothetical protein
VQRAIVGGVLLPEQAAKNLPRCQGPSRQMHRPLLHQAAAVICW